MIRLNRYIPGRRSGGFTLMEILVSLIVGTLIAGGVLGLISVTLQYNHRIRSKSEIQPILESAAELILANPRQAEAGSIVLGELPGSPTVGILLSPVDLPHETRLGTRGGGPTGQLNRIMLVYQGHGLEFSLIIPPPDR
jgi:hypothetical protein